MTPLNYISTYLIKPDSCGQIEGGNNRRPNFNFFKNIEIVSGSNTWKLQTKGQMVKAFNADRKNSNYYFDLLIQDNGKKCQPLTKSIAASGADTAQHQQ